ncbi:MAG: hypothetical protein ACXVRJ_03770 [Gaiellaceae bacterium]
MNLKLLSMLLAVGLAVVVAGCGSGRSDTKANEAFAEGVCTALDTWTSEINSLTAGVGSGISKSSLQKKLTQFQTATKNLVSEIKAVPAPNTSEGKDAKKKVDGLVTQVQATTAAAQAELAKLPSNASLAQIVSSLSTLAPQLTALATGAQSTVSSLQQAGGSLAKAFESARGCSKLSR